MLSKSYGFGKNVAFKVKDLGFSQDLALTNNVTLG